MVSNQHAALQSAQKITQDADEVLDPAVAGETGKVPGRSMAGMPQRVVGTGDTAGARR